MSLKFTFIEVKPPPRPFDITLPFRIEGDHSGYTELVFEDNEIHLVSVSGDMKGDRPDFGKPKKTNDRVVSRHEATNMIKDALEFKADMSGYNRKLEEYHPAVMEELK